MPIYTVNSTTSGFATGASRTYPPSTGGTGTYYPIINTTASGLNRIGHQTNANGDRLIIQEGGRYLLGISAEFNYPNASATYEYDTQVTIDVNGIGVLSGGLHLYGKSAYQTASAGFLRVHRDLLRPNDYITGRIFVLTDHQITCYFSQIQCIKVGDN